jgi:hypothetical protein
MWLSKETIQEYRQIYKKEFGEDLSDGEACKQGDELIVSDVSGSGTV